MGQDRKKLKSEYKDLYLQLSKILFEHDLMGINFEDNTDEYEPEVDTILPRLNNAKQPEDVAEIIFQEFSKWFSIEESKKISQKAYLNMAKDIWETWTEFKVKTT